MSTPLTLSEWLLEMAAIDSATAPPVNERFVDAVLATETLQVGSVQLTDAQLDRAIWNISFSIDEMLVFAVVPMEQKLAVIEALPNLFVRLVALGAERVTAGTYFWEGFSSGLENRESAICSAVVAALDRVACTGTETAFYAVLQALESMHGAPGAAELAERTLGFSGITTKQRQHLGRVLGDLRLFEERFGTGPK